MCGWGKPGSRAGLWQNPASSRTGQSSGFPLELNQALWTGSWKEDFLFPSRKVPSAALSLSLESASRRWLGHFLRNSGSLPSVCSQPHSVILYGRRRLHFPPHTHPQDRMFSVHSLRGGLHLPVFPIHDWVWWWLAFRKLDTSVPLTSCFLFGSAQCRFTFQWESAGHTKLRILLELICHGEYSKFVVRGCLSHSVPFGCSFSFLILGVKWEELFLFRTHFHAPEFQNPLLRLRPRPGFQITVARLDSC